MPLPVSARTHLFSWSFPPPPLPLCYGLASLPDQGQGCLRSPCAPCSSDPVRYTLARRPLEATRTIHMRASGEGEIYQSKPNPRQTCHSRYPSLEWIRQSQGTYTVWANSTLGPEIWNIYSFHWIFLCEVIILPPELREKVWEWEGLQGKMPCNQTL